MQELILYIQPQLVNQTAQDFVRVDLMEAELITITQVIQDVKEIDKIFTDYSRTFNLPASKTNNKIFKYWYNPDVIGFDNQIMASAIIELNHLPFKEGKIKLEEVVMKDGAPSIYKVTFFGNTVSLSNLIGEDQLENLNWLSNFNVLSTFTNIRNGFENGLDITVNSVTYADAIIYPLISVEQPYIYDSGGQFDNFGNIAYGTGTNYNKRGVFPEDLKPAIKVSLILKAIEQQYGLNFKSGEFFDSAAISNLYMWLHREKGKINQTIKSELIIDTSFACAVATNLLSPPESDSCNFFATTSQAKFNNGKWEIEKTTDLSAFSMSVEITTSSVQKYTIEILDELTGVQLGIRSGTGAQTLNLGLFNPNVDDVIDKEMQVGDKKNIIVKISSDSQLTFTSQIQVFVRKDEFTSSAKFYSSVYSHTNQLTTVNDTLSIINNMPKISVLNFLKGLFKMHNLTAFVNDNNEIVVKTLDSFYSGGDTIDISKYVVTDKNTIGANLPFTEIDLQYPEPKTILAQQFLQQNNIRFGELEFISNASKGSKYVVEAPFEKMMFERLNDQDNGNQTSVQYGLFTDDDLKPAIGAPLLFYGVYRQNITPTINYVDTTRPASGTPTSGTQHNINDYWMPSNYNEVGTSTTAPTYNTNFGSEINEYNLTDYGGANNSLFQLYYENYITRVFNKKTRLFKYKAILPLSILIKLSLDDKIIVGTREFTINKMTTKLQSGETELELLNEPS